MFYSPWFLGMHLLWWAFWVVALVLFFAMLIPVPRSSWREYRMRDPSPRETAFDVLQRRYAAGELTAVEYEERRRLLERDAIRAREMQLTTAAPIATDRARDDAQREHEAMP
jgi:putative membrane protein